MDAREKYLNDPVFHTLVDTIYNWIRENHTTPTELREAVMFASTKYAMENPQAIKMSPDFERHIKEKL